MAKIKISDYIVSFVERLGVKYVFTVSGSANVHLMHSFGKSKKLKYICNHHEQASAMAAEAYSRVSGNIGVCIVTAGPGGTNTITGVAGAWLDSIPTLYLSGQVKRENMAGRSGLRQLGIQEINIADIVKPITKYSTVVMRPEEIKYHLQKAVFLARSGRFGPAWIDIPFDVQSAFVEEKDLLSFDSVPENFLNKNILRNQVSKTIKLIQKSKRPVILAGHGISLAEARELFIKLAEQLKIPILTSMSGHDLITSNHQLFCGRPGVFGDRPGNFAIQNADLLIAIGSRLHLWNIGYNPKLFAREAKKVVVDIDKAELKKPSLKVDLAIQSDAKDFIEEFIRQSRNIKLPDIFNWRKKCTEWRKRYPIILPECKKGKKFVNPYYFIDVLSSSLSEGEVIVTGVGTARIGTNQAIRIKKGQRLYYNVGCAAMGYDLPAAIGAYFAAGKKRIILITGEGSLMMNIQELQTISHYKLPVKIFLLNNHSYLTVKQNQDIFFDGRFTAVDEKTGVTFPDFEKVSDAFGIAYEKINNHTDLLKKIKKTLWYQGPILCEINASPDQSFYPRPPLVKRGDGIIIVKPLEDMCPFLERQEFLNNMIVEPIDSK